MNVVFTVKHFLRQNKCIEVAEIYQAQASDQFLATTKLATNKAICPKTKKINKSKMCFKRFL